MKKLALAAVVALCASTALAAGKKAPARAAPARAGLDCAAYKQHLNDVAYANFLATDGKDMSAEEQAAARVMFPAEMEKDPDIQATLASCTRGEMSRAVYDCQMKAKTLDALEACGD